MSSAVLHANAYNIDKVRYAPRWVDVIVRAVHNTCLRRDNSHAILECLFNYQERARHAYGEVSVTYSFIPRGPSG
jgi:hypothetical protein